MIATRVEGAGVVEVGLDWTGVVGSVGVGVDVSEGTDR